MDAGQRQRHPAAPLQGAPNVLPAREFVWWYNGHPDCRDLPVDLSQVRGGVGGGVGGWGCSLQAE
jgi:adrenodoxin-NADP+ reductase